jgi:hypothetical protein
MKFLLENHSGDVNIDSGTAGFFIHSAPESIFTSRRNPYSHRSGTIIHMPRNPQKSALTSTTALFVFFGAATGAWVILSN